MNKQKSLYSLMVGGAVIGMIAAFWQTLEKLTLLKNKDAILSCNLDSAFSCSNVLNAPQSSVFGFPNSIMCLVLFTIFFSIGLVGLCGGQISKRLRLAIQGLSLFTLGFGLWFLFQSTYRIGAICIFCLFCFGGLLLVNGSWLRVNQRDINKPWLDRLIRQGGDLFIWLLIAVMIAASIIFKFYA